MSQGGSSSASPGVGSLRMDGARSCAANAPARGVFRGAHCGPHWPSDGPSRGGQSCLRTRTVGASRGGGGSCLCMPTDGASRGGDPASPESSRGGGGGSVCGAGVGLHSLADEPSRGGGGGASSPRLHMPVDEASRGGDPGLPGPARGGGGSSWSLLHSARFSLSSNASGLAVVASTAPLAGSMPAMP